MPPSKREIGRGKSPPERRREKWPIVKIAGREFHQVRRRELYDLFKGLPGWGPEEEPDWDELVLWPVHPVDDHLQFPANPPVEVVGIWAKAGIASHEVVGRVEHGVLVDVDPMAKFGERLHDAKVVEDLGDKQVVEVVGFSSRQLNVFSEVDWYGACWQVLVEHKWWEPTGDLTAELEERLERVAPGTITEAKEAFGENWAAYAAEIAAIYFCPPLSRLWYAANMMSLYYCHHDDLRLGYLHAEYRMRLRWEAKALKYDEITEGNRENGSKGGQAEKKQQRYAVLDQLAMTALGDLPPLPQPADYYRFAKRLAAEYDKETGEGLFSAGGRHLSREWFMEWLSVFRQKLLTAEKAP